MLRLTELGWGSKWIAAELECSRTHGESVLRQGGWGVGRDRGGHRRLPALSPLEWY
jgi:hypothetical protein